MFPDGVEERSYGRAILGGRYWRGDGADRYGLRGDGRGAGVCFDVSEEEKLVSGAGVADEKGGGAVHFLLTPVLVTIWFLVFWVVHVPGRTVCEGDDPNLDTFDSSPDVCVLAVSIACLVVPGRSDG